jgi:hypothetical protein
MSDSIAIYLQSRQSTLLNSCILRMCNANGAQTKCQIFMAIVFIVIMFGQVSSLWKIENFVHLSDFIWYVCKENVLINCNFCAWKVLRKSLEKIKARRYEPWYYVLEMLAYGLCQ